jgi:GMP synthase (glutamine-hydrolysing)
MSAESAELVRGIDYIVTSEIKKYLKESGKKITQYFGVLLPVSSSSSKKYSAVIRAFITVDFMSGHAALPGRDIPVEVLQSISAKITAEFAEIDLVLYDMTGKPPATVEWE